MEFGKGIPCLDFSINPKDLVEGSEGWKKLCKQVREASEEHGCFQVMYDNKVPVKQHEEMYMAIKELFDLPLETLKKHVGSKGPYDGGYIGKNPKSPLFEYLGIEDPELPGKLTAFTDLMWPGTGNPKFCNTLESMSKVMLELGQMLHKMIFDSYGVRKHYESNAEDTDIALHLIKYSVPPSNQPEALGAGTHTDKSLLTILSSNLPGLELLSKDDVWIPFEPRQGAFNVFIGDQLKAWSNGRLRIRPHKVTMRVEKERYTCGLFITPKAEAMIQVQPELVDEDHPLVYRPFKNSDFLRYYYADVYKDDVLRSFAGVAN